MEIAVLVLGFVFKFVLPAIGAAATAATLTPNQHSNRLGQAALTGVNMAGMNLGKASNK